jgi:signal transduction histidine kinase
MTTDQACVARSYSDWLKLIGGRFELHLAGDKLRRRCSPSRSWQSHLSASLRVFRSRRVHSFPLFYICPCLSSSGDRSGLGPKGAAGAVLVLAVVSIWLTLSGLSPFFDETPERSVVALQLFLIGVAVPALLLSAVIDQLRESERATRATAGLIVSAQDEERRRIARDLHDSTSQNLMATDLMLGGLKEGLPPSAIASVEKCSDLIQQSMRELRTLAYVLHLPMLDEEGLRLALPSYVEGFTERSGIDIDLTIAPAVGRLPREIELVFFRIVQEALSNVHRHSGSSTAQIELVRQRIRLREFAMLTIEDRGRGMPQSQDKQIRRLRGVGLDSMRERVNQVGGDLIIESRPGRTVLSVRVPVPSQWVSQ